MFHPISKANYDPLSNQTHNYIHSQAHSPIQQLIQTGLAQLAEQQRHSDNNVLAILQSDLQQLETDLQSHLRLLTDNVEQLGQTWRETMPSLDSSLSFSLETTAGEDSLSLLNKAVTCITQQQALITELVSASETQQQAISDLESKLDDLTQLSTTCSEQVNSLLQQLKLLNV